MHNSMNELFLYILLGILMSSFIKSLGLLPFDLTLRLAIDGPYILSALLISATAIGQFYIMLVDTIFLKFFTAGRPKLLYIFLANLALYICMLMNPTIFSSIGATNFEFSVV